MSKVIMEMSVSLDGYVTGPHVRPEEPMGDGGERLHEWMFAGKSAKEVETFQTAKYSEIGALIVGRRMADLGIGPWGEEPAFHAPCFVVTHHPAKTIVKKGRHLLHLRHRRDRGGPGEGTTGGRPARRSG